METLELVAEPRNQALGSAKKLRRQGYVPVVLYGKSRETESLQINARALDKVMSVAGTHQLVALQINNKKVVTLAREIQRDYIKQRYLHVDFQEVRMDEKLHTQIPLVLVGVAPAVDLGGVLTYGLDMLDVECLPTALVDAIEVDISGLAQFNDTMTVADLMVPKDITILSDLDTVVARIEAPRKVEELETLEEEVSGAEPEVITESKGKGEE